MKLKNILLATVLAGSTLMAGSASAFFGGWGPWDWFDDDDWYDYPPPWYYGGYPGYGYPGYGYGVPYGYGAPYGYAPYGYGGGYPYGSGYGYPYGPSQAPQTTQPAPNTNNPGK